MNFLGSFLQALKPRYDDDVIDRLNYYYSTIIILILAITISAKQYVGQPIQCWVPAQFTGSWEQYAENYCFVQNTYWASIHEPIPSSHESRRQREIGYYQWVPFILAIEALFFYVPCVVWRVLNFQSGFSVETMVKLACEADNIGTDHRQKAVKTVSMHIEDSLNLQYGLAETESSFSRAVKCGRARGVYVTSTYLLVKALYVMNVIGQFFLLNAFLHTRSYFWGYEILQDLWFGKEWENSGNFPRVTLCDFEVSSLKEVTHEENEAVAERSELVIRVLGNIHRHSIQCVLMINMFNEKIFLFLWWWFVLVIAANVGSFIYWLVIMCPYRRREVFIARYLKSSLAPDARDTPGLSRFVEYGLRPDGVFMLRLLAINAGELVTTEIMDELWSFFQARMQSDTLYRGQQGKRRYGHLSFSQPLEPTSTRLVIDTQKNSEPSHYSQYQRSGRSSSTMRRSGIVSPASHNQSIKTPT